jgi:hypothetical protein
MLLPRVLDKELVAVCAAKRNSGHGEKRRKDRMPGQDSLAYQRF